MALICSTGLAWSYEPLMMPLSPALSVTRAAGADILQMGYMVPQ